MTEAYDYFPPHHQTIWNGCAGYAGWAVRRDYCTLSPRARIDVGPELRRYDYGLLA